MGGNPRHRTWGWRQWANVAWTVGEIAERGWRVEAGCQTCRDRFRVRLDVVIQMRGHNFALWGRQARCPRLRCVGSVWFYVFPRGADGDFLMMKMDPPKRADRDAARLLET